MLPLIPSWLLDPRERNQPLDLLLGLRGELDGWHLHGEHQGREGLVMEQVGPHPLSLKKTKTHKKTKTPVFLVSLKHFTSLLFCSSQLWGFREWGTRRHLCFSSGLPILTFYSSSTV